MAPFEGSMRPIFVLLLVSFLTLGCGSGGPELGRVKGKVTVDGKPVPRATITFYPEFQGSTSYGVTDEKGDYELKFTDTDYGAMIGKFRVGIATKKIPKAEMPDTMSPEEMAKLNAQHVEIPKRYRGDDSFHVEVKSGNNTIDLTMESK
jgi:hypothetical protein